MSELIKLFRFIIKIYNSFPKYKLLQLILAVAVLASALEMKKYKKSREIAFESFYKSVRDHGKSLIIFINGKAQVMRCSF